MQKPPPIPVYKPPSKALGWGIVALLVALIAVIVVLGVVWLKGQISRTDFTNDNSTRQFVIGNDVLNIPLNHMRFGQQREKSVLEQADLAMLWPSGDGYGQKHVEAFKETGPDRRLLFITLSKRAMPFDMTGRLEPIYVKLFDGQPTQGPAGLQFQSLKPGKGYDGEQLAIFAEGNEVWIARCQTVEQSTSPTCLRDVFLGNDLSLRYRFPLALLKHWRGIEALVVGKISSMLVQ